MKTGQADPTGAAPEPGSLAALAALGALGALLSLFLWMELVVARSGGTGFCAVGEAADCTRLWDGAFAAAIHRLTGVPIAGWGLAWNLIAFALPLVALLAVAKNGPAGTILSAVRVCAAAGLLAVLALMGVSAAEGVFCVGCAATYVLVFCYCGIALLGWRRLGLPAVGPALALCAACALSAYLVLLYPGLHTPRDAARAGREAVAAAASSPTAPAAAHAAHDPRLTDFVTSLPPDAKQLLSDSLELYRRGPMHPLPAPRGLIGPENAPVRITAFTDVLCSHCATLHETLETLRQHLPEGSFSLEPRQYPLDAACNPQVQRRDGNPVNCLGARASICLADRPDAFQFSGALFANQQGLTSDKLFSLAAPFGARGALQQCLRAPATQARLEEDIAFAARYRPDGTPMVLVNGRKGTSFGPFLYAMVLTEGAADHPAFAGLPPPRPDAHIH